MLDEADAVVAASEAAARSRRKLFGLLQASGRRSIIRSELVSDHTVAIGTGLLLKTTYVDTRQSRRG